MSDIAIPDAKEIFQNHEKEMNELHGMNLSKDATDLYIHEVIAHAFIGYNQRAAMIGNSPITLTKKQIIREEILAGNESYKQYEKFLLDPDFPSDIHSVIYREKTERFHELFKKEYVKWAKTVGIEEQFIEQGWQEYQND
ncbi:MAG: hypothetical protein KJ697_03645 [Nanoarchaeota archaeon]|nr:hypothetical protein [Nanoarchaeota archaeon]MBU4123970.1 hypothetical protein [Nanoarchaeota archaeon]